MSGGGPNPVQTLPKLESKNWRSRLGPLVMARAGAAPRGDSAGAWGQRGADVGPSPRSSAPRLTSPSHALRRGLCFAHTEEQRAAEQAR